MNHYEVVYIYDSALDESRLKEKLEHHHRLVAGNGHGEVTAVDHWGKRQLTYPIRKRAAGYYVVAQFRTDPSALPEFERALKLDEDLLRYLLVLHQGEPTAPLSPMTREPKPRDEDEDEGSEPDVEEV